MFDNFSNIGNIVVEVHDYEQSSLQRIASDEVIIVEPKCNIWDTIGTCFITGFVLFLTGGGGYIFYMIFTSKMFERE